MFPAVRDSQEKIKNPMKTHEKKRDIMKETSNTPVKNHKYTREKPRLKLRICEVQGRKYRNRSHFTRGPQIVNPRISGSDSTAKLQDFGSNKWATCVLQSSIF